MAEFKIIDNFLSIEEADAIENVLLGDAKIPWYLSKSLYEENIERLSKKSKLVSDSFEHVNLFNHVFYNYNINSNFYDLLSPILKRIHFSALVRIKGNLLWRTESIKNTGFHDDNQEKTHSLLYYVNTNNGLTIFEDGTKVQSIKNRILIFKSSVLHAGTTCTDSDYRCNINFIFHKSVNSVDGIRR